MVRNVQIEIRDGCFDHGRNIVLPALRVLANDTRYFQAIDDYVLDSSLHFPLVLSIGISANIKDIIRRTVGGYQTALTWIATTTARSPPESSFNPVIGVAPAVFLSRLKEKATI